jgi:hypothetical protein
MSEETIFYEEKEKEYYIFINPVCYSCNKIIEGSAYCKAWDKTKKFYCDSQKCIEEYKKVEQNGQNMFNVVIGKPNNYLNGKWAAVIDYNNITTPTNSFKDSIIQSNKLSSEKSTYNIDKTRLANKGEFSLKDAQIGKDIIPELEEKDNKELTTDAVNSFFTDIKNSNLITNEETKRLE